MAQVKVVDVVEALKEIEAYAGNLRTIFEHYDQGGVLAYGTGSDGSEKVSTATLDADRAARVPVNVMSRGC